MGAVSLAHQPPVVLSLITRWVDYHEIFTLVYLCGDSALKTKLCDHGGVTELQVASKSSARLFQVLERPARFVHLVSLVIASTTLRLRSCASWILLLPSTLGEIRFNFFNALESFTRPCSDKDDEYTRSVAAKNGLTSESMQDRFHNLRILHCEGRRAEVGESLWNWPMLHRFLHHLPLSLTSLRLSMPSGSQWNSLLVPFPPVFRQLEDLSLHAGRTNPLKALLFAESVALNDKSDPFELGSQYAAFEANMLPNALENPFLPELKSLSLHPALHDDFLPNAYYFSNLEALDLDLSTSRRDSAPIEHLPKLALLRKLKRLTLNSHGFSTKDQEFVDHLVNLTSLNMQQNSYSSDPIQAPSLTHQTALQKLSLSSAPGYLPPSVKYFDLASSQPDEHVLNLLDNVEQFHWTYNGLREMQAPCLTLPASVTVLELNCSPLQPNLLLVLPKSLKRLTCPVWVTNEIITPDVTVWNVKNGHELVHRHFLPHIAVAALSITLHIHPAYIKNHFGSSKLVRFDHTGPTVEVDRHTFGFDYDEPIPPFFPATLTSLGGISLRSAVEMSMLPPNIKSLDVMDWYWRTTIASHMPLITAPVAGSDALPPLIQTLKMYSASLYDPSMSQGLYMPLIFQLKHLQTLGIIHLVANDYSFIQQLPRSITSLTLGLRAHLDEYIPKAIPPNFWPPKLKYLYMPSTRIYLSSLSPVIWQLKALKCKELRITDDAIKDMPKNLSEISFATAHLLCRSAMPLRLFLPDQITVRVEWTERLLNKLPRSLTTANFARSLDWCLLDAVPPQAFGKWLPPSLKTLHLDSKTSKIASFLPQGLTTLSMWSYWTSANDFTALPPQLTNISFYEISFFDENIARKLPPSLISLTMSLRTRNTCDEAALQMLPSQLRSLTLGKNFGTLIRLPHLQSLPKGIVSVQLDAPDAQFNDSFCAVLRDALPSLAFFGATSGANLLYGA